LAQAEESGQPATLEAQAYTLSIENARQLAVDRNTSLASLREKIIAAKAREGRSLAGFYPKLETKFGSEQAGSSGSSVSSASGFGYLAATWNIYRGGLDVAAARSALLETKLAEHEYEIQRLAVEREVEAVYSNILYLRDVSLIKERFIGINAKQQALARQIVNRGGGSQSDVVEFDLKTGTLKSELAQIEQNYRGFVIKLKSLIAEDFARNPSPTGQLPHQHLKYPLSTYMDARLADAPAVKTTAIHFDLAAHKSLATRGRWLPQVDLEGQFGDRPLSIGGSDNNLGGSVAVVATWEIFGGFETAYEGKERLAEKATADWMLKSDITALLADVESGYGELVTIQKRSDQGKANIELAKRYYELVSADFMRGYKNSADFNSAAQTWYEAEVERKRLDLEFVEKKIQLEAKLGKRIETVTMKDVDNG